MTVIYITDSSTEIDTGKPLQSLEIFAFYSFHITDFGSVFTLDQICCFVLIVFHRQSPNSTSFHLMIGQSVQTLQTCIIEVNWIVYQKILLISAFWLTDFADKEPARSKSIRIYIFRFYSVKNIVPFPFQSTWVLGKRPKLLNSDITIYRTSWS